MDVLEDLSLAISAAKKAASVISRSFLRIKRYSIKEGKGFVTEVDTESEKAILEELQSHSTYSIYTEEAGKIQGDAKGEWIIDPLDGTTNFLCSIPLFAVSIALKKGNDIVLGVVVNPISGELFYAERGKGAFFNEKPIHVSDHVELKNSCIFPNHGYDAESTKNYVEVIKRLATNSYLRQFGSSALELCYVARGNVDGFICSGDELYDYAAGLVILEEAGGKVTDWNGGKWSSDNNFILASNAKMHEDLIVSLRGIQIS